MGMHMRACMRREVCSREIRDRSSMSFLIRDRSSMSIVSFLIRDRSSMSFLWLCRRRGGSRCANLGGGRSAGGCARTLWYRLRPASGETDPRGDTRSTEAAKIVLSSLPDARPCARRSFSLLTRTSSLASDPAAMQGRGCDPLRATGGHTPTRYEVSRPHKTHIIHYVSRRPDAERVPCDD